MDYFGVDLDHIIHCFEEKLIRDKYELSLDIRDFLNPTEILTTAKSNEINTLAHAPADVPQHTVVSTTQHCPPQDKPDLMLRTRRIPSTRNLYNHQLNSPPKYGLPGLGEYEEKRKKYQAEWKQDYNNYMRNHASRPRRKVNKELDSVALDYDEVLSKKREEERHYRQHNDSLEYNFGGVKAAHSDSHLNSLPVSRAGYGMSLQHEVEEMNDMLNRMQPITQVTGGTYGYERYDVDDDHTRPHSYPTESNIQGVFPSNSKYNIDHHREFRANGRSGSVGQALGSHDRHKKNAYQADLAQQMEETRLRRQRERDEQLKLEKKIEEENKNYDPWGRGGAGAPVRDRNGRVIAVRKQLATGQTYHPNASPRIHSELSPRQPNPTESLPNYAIPRSPTLKGKQGYLGDHSSENYRDELKRQIEEKKQREKKTKEKERLEDERLFQKIQEENERMQRDFDEETNKQKQREEERRRRNEEMQRLQEERRKDAETQKKKQQERRNRERLEARDHLSVEAPSKTDPVIKSPPLPTMRTKQVPPDNSSKSMGKKVAVYKPTKGADVSKDRLLSQLTAMRQQLEKEQHLMQQQIKIQMQTDYEVYDNRIHQPDKVKRDSDVPMSFMNHPVTHLPKTENQNKVPPAVKYNPPLLKDFKPQHQNPTASMARKMWPAMAIAVRATEGLKPLHGESLFLGVSEYELSSPKHNKQHKLGANHNRPSDDYQYYPEQMIVGRGPQSRSLVPTEGDSESAYLDEFLAKNLIT